MEPLKILSKELNPKCISLRSRQLPSMLNQLNDIFPRRRSPTPCRSENSKESKPIGNLSKELIQEERAKETNINNTDIQKYVFNNTPLYKGLQEMSNQNGSNPLKKVGCMKINKCIKRKYDVSNINLLKPGYGLDYRENIPKSLMQQTRFYHKKVDKPKDAVIQGISRGILSKEALLDHHMQRNVSHFALFDPAMAALNLSALQPSKAGFNVRKLIAKTYKDHWDWSLPSEFVQVKTGGPGINDNLIDFVDQKMRIQAETRRKFKPLEEKVNTKIRNLMNKARNMNMAAEKLREATLMPPDPKEKRLFRTVSKIINPNKHPSEKCVKKAAVEKSFQRRQSTILSERSDHRHTEPEEMVTNKKDTTGDSQTAYQPTASYREVFYKILNKSRKKSKGMNNLSVFNRPALETNKSLPKPANKSTLSNINSYMSARGKSEKQLDNEGKRSQTSLNRSSMKDVPRTPFQKVKDSLFTKSAKASFSTESKTKLNTLSMLVKKKEIAKGFSTIAINKPKAVAKGKVVKPKVRPLNYQMRNKSTVNVPKFLKLTQSNIKASPKQGKIEGKILERQDSKIFCKTNKQGTSNKFNKQPSRTFFSYHGQNTAGSHKQIKENKTFLNTSSQSNITLKPRVMHRSCPKRTFHIQNGTIFEPIEEKVFHELLNLCESSKKVGEAGRRVQSAKQSLQESCRSLNEKKVSEKKKGLVCRIASMFNIACGRECKCPPRGCTKCGNKF